MSKLFATAVKSTHATESSAPTFANTPKSHIRAIITQRIYAYEPYRELWECLDSKLQGFLLECGIVGFGISCEQIKCVEELFSGIDMLVLSGGNDIGAYSCRDSFELALIEYALANHIKILAICRGMQILARYFDICLESSAHKVGAAHTLQGTLTHEVHSYHNFCIKQPPHGFEVLAYIDDEIEAMRSEQALALMWHPERELADTARSADIALIRAFLNNS